MALGLTDVFFLLRLRRPLELEALTPPVVHSLLVLSYLLHQVFDLRLIHHFVEVFGLEPFSDGSVWLLVSVYWRLAGALLGQRTLDRDREVRRHPAFQLLQPQLLEGEFRSRALRHFLFHLQLVLGLLLTLQLLEELSVGAYGLLPEEQLGGIHAWTLRRLRPHVLSHFFLFEQSPDLPLPLLLLFPSFRLLQLFVHERDVFGIFAVGRDFECVLRKPRDDVAREHHFLRLLLRLLRLGGEGAVDQGA